MSTRRKILKGIIIIIALAVAALFLMAFNNLYWEITGERLFNPPTFSSNRTNASTTNTLQEATVTNVIDAVTFETSTGERVRLVGVVCTVKSHGGWTEEAKEFTTELILNQTVWLDSDIVGPGRFPEGTGLYPTNMHNTRLRYVWLSEPTDTTDEEQIILYQLGAQLVLGGHAIASTDPNDWNLSRR